jgi:AcrR family transcriptional regulator
VPTKKRRAPRPKKPPRRRTQEERSATTRALLLDATIDCLYDVGYTNTTTTEIAKRAGVSRGAQLHHFPTKLALVTTAVDHLFDRRQDEFRSTFAQLPHDADPIVAAIDMAWSMVNGKTFYAWLELLVAARTDSELKKRVAAIAERFDREGQRMFRELFALDAKTSELVLVACTLALATMEGLAAAKIAIGDHPHVTRTIELLKMIAPQIFGSLKKR